MLSCVSVISFNDPKGHLEVKCGTTNKLVSREKAQGTGEGAEEGVCVCVGGGGAHGERCLPSYLLTGHI